MLRGYFRDINPCVMKEVVRNVAAGILVVTSLMACERVDVGSGRKIPVEKPDVPEEELLFSGVKYPEGYDWMKDPEYGSVDCSLFLASENDWIIQERKVGHDHKVASDSDMHRVLDGSLWEDWSTETETIVTRDGVEAFRWQGRECISEAILCDGHLYTLGYSREDGSMCLRRDGMLQMNSPTIYPVSPLHEDMGAVCLAAKSGEGRTLSWYAVREGAAILVSSPRENSQVCGVHFVRGQLVVLSMSSGGTLWYSRGTDDTIMSVLASSVTIDRIVSDGGNVFVIGSKWQEDGPRRLLVWRNGVLYLEGPKKFEMFSFSQDGDDICFLGQNRLDGNWQLIHGGETILVPYPYRPYSRDAILLRDGAVYMSLVRDNSVPVLWMDGEIREYSFNGYIDHLEMVSADPAS